MTTQHFISPDHDHWRIEYNEEQQRYFVRWKKARAQKTTSHLSVTGNVTKSTRKTCSVKSSSYKFDFVSPRSVWDTDMKLRHFVCYNVGGFRVEFNNENQIYEVYVPTNPAMNWSYAKKDPRFRGEWYIYSDHVRRQVMRGSFIEVRCRRKAERLLKDRR